MPDLEKIEVPMLICASFSDGNLHSRGSFRAFQQVGSADKFVYTHRGGKWASFYSDPARQAQLGFFDRYLKGREIPKPPPVRLEVRERGNRVAEVRAEREWPLARTNWRDLYLGPGGTLRESAPPDGGSVTFATRASAAAFTFPITSDLELTGPMSLSLWVSVQGADDTGQLVPLEIALGPSSTLFRAGDSLRLLVAGRSLAPRNPLTSTFPAAYAPAPRARCTVHWGPDMPARLRVPVIPQPSRGPCPQV